MHQHRDVVPLYDHPDRSDSLGRRRRLFREGVDPDQPVTVTSAASLHEETARRLEPEVVS